MQSPKQEQRRMNYKSDIRRLLALGLTTEAIARIFKEKHSTSRTTGKRNSGDGTVLVRITPEKILGERDTAVLE